MTCIITSVDFKNEKNNVVYILLFNFMNERARHSVLSAASKYLTHFKLLSIENNIKKIVH